MEAHHDHTPNAACLPPCPAWAEGALQLFAVQRRFAEMLEACRTAAAIEWLYVAPSSQGVDLPDYLEQEDLIRLKLRDTPTVLLDEWGVRCELTFRGHPFACAFPWHSIRGGVLRPPKRPRFGVIQGGKKD